MGCASAAVSMAASASADTRLNRSGAGNPTLFNRVLNNWEGRRVAVIVNDVSEVNHHADLVCANTGHSRRTARQHYRSNGRKSCSSSCAAPSTASASLGSILASAVWMATHRTSNSSKPSPLIRPPDQRRSGSIHSNPGALSGRKIPPVRPELDPGSRHRGRLWRRNRTGPFGHRPLCPAGFSSSAFNRHGRASGSNARQVVGYQPGRRNPGPARR